MSGFIEKDEALFLNAELYRDAAQVIYRRLHNQDIQPLAAAKIAIVGITNEAIAIELYFKCLVLIGTGAILEGHKYPILYDALLLEHKNKIKLYYDEFTQKNIIVAKIKQDHPDVDFSFHAVLSECESAFQKFRYEFEYGPSSYMLSDVAQSLHKLILEIKPLFKQVVSPQKSNILPPAIFYKLVRNRLVLANAEDADSLHFNAYCFDNCADLLAGRIYKSESHPNDKWHFYLPAVGNQAFAIELYLKLLLSFEEVQGRGHNIENLFYRLSLETQTKIKEYYDDFRKNTPTKIKIGSPTSILLDDYELPTVIHAARNAIISFRYIFEDRLEIYALVDLLHAIRKRILDMHPNPILLLGFDTVEFYPHAAIVK